MTLKVFKSNTIVTVSLDVLYLRSRYSVTDISTLYMKIHNSTFVANKYETIYFESLTVEYIMNVQDKPFNLTLPLAFPVKDTTEIV